MAELWGESFRTRLMRNIRLLHALDPVIESPHENQISDRDAQGRQLSIQRERELADAFALLAATDENPKRVMAVAVEEIDDRHLTIQVASNNGYCQSAEEGLQKLANSLETARTRGKTLLGVYGFYSEPTSMQCILWKRIMRSCYTSLWPLTEVRFSRDFAQDIGRRPCSMPTSDLFSIIWMIFKAS